MASFAPAPRMAAGALLLLLLSCLLPHAGAQQPPVQDPNSNAFAFVVTCTPALVEVGYLQAAEFPCVHVDTSRDTSAIPGQGSGFSVTPHTTIVELVDVEPPEAKGWQLSIGQPFVSSFGGMVTDLRTNVKTTPEINTPFVTFRLLATFSAPNGYVLQQNVTISAKVKPYDFAQAEIVSGKIKKAGQDDQVAFVVEVRNLGVYPDVFEFSVTSQDPSFQVTTPPGIYVPPLSTGNATVYVNTPNDKLYEFTRTTLVSVRVKSTTGNGQYDTNGIVQVRGLFIPVHWIPLVLVGLASAAVVARGARERSELRRLEKGRPRRVQPTPRQAVLLQELRRKDPERYKARKAALDAVYKERRGHFLAAWRARKAGDREEARQARREFKEARKRRKAEEKARRTREKREAKARKAQDRAEAKLRSKKEKELARKRKVLEKKKARLAKRQAKVDARQAKRDAKAQAQADKAARRQAKADAKAAKRRGENP